MYQRIGEQSLSVRVNNVKTKAYLHDYLCISAKINTFAPHFKWAYLCAHSNYLIIL